MNSRFPANSLNIRASANIIGFIKSLVSELSIDALPVYQTHVACISLSPTQPIPTHTPVYLTGFSISLEHSIVCKSCPGPTSAAWTHLRFRERSSGEWKGGAGISTLCALHLALSELRAGPDGGNDAKAAVESFTHLYALAVTITKSSRWHTAEELARLCANTQVGAMLAVLSSEGGADPNSWKWVVYHSSQVNGNRSVIALVRRGAYDHYNFLTRNKTNPEKGRHTYWRDSAEGVENIKHIAGHPVGDWSPQQTTSVRSRAENPQPTSCSISQYSSHPHRWHFVPLASPARFSPGTGHSSPRTNRLLSAKVGCAGVLTGRGCTSVQARECGSRVPRR